MPLLEIKLWKGVDEKKKERLITELTDVVMKVIECPKEAVMIMVHEIPKENWASGGIQHSKKFPKPG